VQAVPLQYDLEFVAITAVVFAAVGSPEQRKWAYHTLAAQAGLHALVGAAPPTTAWSTTTSASSRPRSGGPATRSAISASR